ncbi:MAG: hypothetical protein HZB51_13545 [Chloroflexi bacterium]|nr:hypothetical protein [Chloroflexota bacterium]
MEKRHRVVLYGNSLSMLGIEASLKECPSLEVLRVESRFPNTLQVLEPLCADVITFDVAAGQPEFAFHLLQRQPMLRFIGLDTTEDKAFVLSSEQCTVESIADLLQVITKVPGTLAQSAKPIAANSDSSQVLGRL